MKSVFTWPRFLSSGYKIGMEECVDFHFYLVGLWLVKKKILPPSDNNFNVTQFSVVGNLHFLCFCRKDVLLKAKRRGYGSNMLEIMKAWMWAIAAHISPLKMAGKIYIFTRKLQGLWDTREKCLSDTLSCRTALEVMLRWSYRIRSLSIYVTVQAIRLGTKAWEIQIFNTSKVFGKKKQE